MELLPCTHLLEGKSGTHTHLRGLPAGGLSLRNTRSSALPVLEAAGRPGVGVLTHKRERCPSGAQAPLRACAASKGPHKAPRVHREAQDVVYLCLLFHLKFCLLLTSEKGGRELQPSGNARCSSWHGEVQNPTKQHFPCNSPCVRAAE